MRIIGRNNEIAELNAIVQSGVSEFAVVYGRHSILFEFIGKGYESCPEC